MSSSSGLNRFGVAMLVALAALGCESTEREAPALIRPVRYELVFPMSSTRDRAFAGVAHAGVESKLSFRVPGKVDTVAVVVGDRVKPGQLIATLDSQDFEIDVQRSAASLTQAKAEARNAAANYERIRQLYENRNASRADLDSARAANESAAAAVVSVAMHLQLARRQLAYTRLQAPVEGAIAAVPVEVNENVRAGQEVALLTSGAAPEVQVAMPGTFIARVQNGQRVKVAFDAIRDRDFGAVVSEVGVAATGSATTFPVKATLTEVHPSMRPGMAATVTFRFETDSEEGAMVVPSVAVGEHRGGRFVFVLDAAAIAAPGEAQLAVARRVPVEVGELTADGLVIRSGLSGGELLVTAGVRRIREGQTVKLAEPAEF